MTLTLQEATRAPFPSLDDGFGHWLAGLTDGEGCFYIKVDFNQLKRGGGAGKILFHIALRLDDREILEQICETTGLGVVQVQRGPRSSGFNLDGTPKTSSPLARWKVQKKQDCQRLVQIFDEYPLRAKKARDFALWRLAVKHHATFGRGWRADWSVIEELADELRRVRKYDSALDDHLLGIHGGGRQTELSWEG